MSIKISALPSATSVGDNDLVPIVQGGETKKAPASAFGGGGGGTSDYTDLSNKPSINSVTLTGNKTSGDLNLVGTRDIATTIDSTSTNSQVAGAKAVYDATHKPYGRYVLSTNQTITPNTNYDNSVTLVKLTTDVAISSEYLTYNETTGVYTFNKAGRYKVTLRTQLRGSANTSTGLYVMKGFAFSSATSLTSTYIICNEQGYIEDFSTLYDVGTYVANVGDQISMSAYCFVRRGSIGSYTMQVIASERTTMEIEYEGETAATRSLNLTRGTSTGSLVGMGDRAEVTVEEKTVEVEPIETLKEEKESGDTI